MNPTFASGNAAGTFSVNMTAFKRQKLNAKLRTFYEISSPAASEPPLLESPSKAKGARTTSTMDTTNTKTVAQPPSRPHRRLPVLVSKIVWDP